MTDPKLASFFPILLQRFFVEHLGNERMVSTTCPRSSITDRPSTATLCSPAFSAAGAGDAS
ncbi:hypothetical protein NKJ46_22715 [Mesorhizobium sp. M0166]|uniref:hypothetical protein n=1 Tax=unclassified Mesorhizobium TaxID=325217 RepID=UPI003339828C